MTLLRNPGLLIFLLLLVAVFSICPVMADDTANTTDPVSNIAIFGNNLSLLHSPVGYYSSLGGSSAIRMNGSIDTFFDPFVWYLRGYRNTGWWKVTHGAAINYDNCLITDPGALTVNPAEPVPEVNYTCVPVPGKQFVAVSPYMDEAPYHGWPVLYRDADWQIRISQEGGGSPAPDTTYPGGTGWKRIASSSDHALALHSNGTVTGWGNNTYHQLNLPAGIEYSRIAAGMGFSLGLSKDGTIYAVGNDDFGQVSNVPNGTHYRLIVAGNGTAAAINRENHIVVWGKPLQDTPLFLDGWYSDLSIGPDYLIAIQEFTRPCHLIGPISPGKELQCEEDNQTVQVAMESSVFPEEE